MQFQMLILSFNRIFKLKGIQRPSKHLTALGYSTGTATKMNTNQYRTIYLDQLERFCADFNCTPNDILDFRPNANDDLPADHALHSLTKQQVSDEINTIINNLSVEKIQQIHDIIKNME